MVFMLKEEDASRIFKKYRNAAAFTLDNKLKGLSDDGIEISYKKLTFLPDDDTINGIKNGDMKLKKVIKEAIESLRKPNVKDTKSLALGIGMTELVNIITSNRKHRKGPAVLVFVYQNDADPERVRILKKYLKEIFAEYGLKVITKEKPVKKIFKKRKKAKDKVIKYIRGHKGMTLNKRGVELKNLNSAYYDLELRAMSMSNIDSTSDLDKNEVASCTKALIKSYSAENLKNVEDKKTCKRLAKKDHKAVDAYDELRDILKTMNLRKKLPKVKYGQKKKKGEAVGRKMDTDKFVKFFRKKKNRGYLLLVYAHYLAKVVGLDVGSKEYNAHMKGACKTIGNDNFTKEFIAAANAFGKSAVK